IVIGRPGTSNNGFPSKLWSIMAAGQAVIASFDLKSELCNFINDGHCGIAIEAGSKMELEEAILLLYNNKELTRKMGENAREYVSSKFSRKEATKKIIKEIKDTYNLRH